MIDPKSRSLEWILESCRINKVSDPTLMEKTIRAFSLHFMPGICCHCSSASIVEVHRIFSF